MAGKNWPEPISDQDFLVIFHYLNERFGISLDSVIKYKWFKKGHNIYVLQNSKWLDLAFRYNIEQVGIKVLSFKSFNSHIFLAPNKHFVTVFQNEIKKARIYIEMDLLEELKNGGLLVNFDIKPGYVILHIKGLGDFGIGYYKNNKLTLTSSWL